MSARATVYWEWTDCVTRTKHRLQRRARIVDARRGLVAYDVPSEIPLGAAHRIYAQVRVSYPWKKRMCWSNIQEWPL